jgi:DNA-binding beta-propeller fold protein YncE
VRRYNGPGNDADLARAVGVSPDGSKVFVTGQSSGSTGPFDYATIAYGTSNGATLWVSRYNRTADSSDQAFALGVSPDGSKVFVTGGSAGSTSDYDYATVAYSA